MRHPSLVLVPIALLGLAACSGGGSTPTQPQTATVLFVYQSLVDGGPVDRHPAGPGCAKHVRRNHLVPRWEPDRREVELGPQLDDFYVAEVAAVPTGRRLAVTVFDLAQCAHPTQPWGVVTRRLTANGVELTDVVTVQDPATAQSYPSLAFTVRGDGTVVP